MCWGEAVGLTIITKSSIIAVWNNVLREKCPNTEFFLVRIFPHSDWIRRNTPYLFVFSPNAGKYGPEKLWIQALFTSWIIPDQLRIIWKNWTTATHFYLKASENKILGDFDEEIFDLNSASFSLSITLKNVYNSTCIGLILTNCPNHF